jgi:hypothetical protein
MISTSRALTELVCHDVISWSHFYKRHSRVNPFTLRAFSMANQVLEHQPLRDQDLLRSVIGVLQGGAKHVGVKPTASFTFANAEANDEQTATKKSIDVRRPCLRANGNERGEGSRNQPFMREPQWRWQATNMTALQ